ncbi:MAG: DUF1826 domain-containing protein [Microscillaceae bacterium]|jgi:hypothetical protein|nr:DUF1826 domain-containing protein [Microscillaceae bacterium]
MLLTQTIQKSSRIEVLAQIHEASAVIWQRNLSAKLQTDITQLLNQADFSKIYFKESVADVIWQLFDNQILRQLPDLQADIIQLVEQFAKITQATQIRFELSAISSDMCRKFHTDVTDYRLLCSYAGVGTYFVAPEDLSGKLTDNPPSELIQQTALGEVLIFRGAMAATAESPALLHKSPPAQQLGIKRLLLRLDTEGMDWVN